MTPLAREPVCPEDLFYGFCFALNELHRHVHGLPPSAAKVALGDVVERLRELTQGLRPLTLTEETAMSEKLDARLNAFTYHDPSPDVQTEMTHLRQAFQRLATHLDTCMPECREKSLAFTALEECAMWAMKALALTDPGGVVVDPPPTA